MGRAPGRTDGLEQFDSVPRNNWVEFDSDPYPKRVVGVGVKWAGRWEDPMARSNLIPFLVAIEWNLTPTPLQLRS